MKKWFKPWPETWFKLKQREKELNGQGELFQLQKLNIQNSSKLSYYFDKILEDKLGVLQSIGN